MLLGEGQQYKGIWFMGLLSQVQKRSLKDAVDHHDWVAVRHQESSTVGKNTVHTAADCIHLVEAMSQMWPLTTSTHVYTIAHDINAHIMYIHLTLACSITMMALQWCMLYIVPYVIQYVEGLNTCNKVHVGKMWWKRSVQHMVLENATYSLR